MYGLWLFKEIKTEYGYCKVEIYRKGYDGSELEIGALAANSLTISLENLSEITAPVGKSVCSFAIIDTDQVDYDAFFTPDATAYKVVVSSKVGSGAYITRWSGYVTPDFFAENLSYRTPISISARDNIGYLNDVDFDLVQSAITIRELITKAFARIASDYPMSLEFVSQKQTAEGILAIDATISTALLKEVSWYEALETVLHDLGLQMRWVDNNTIAVMDLSQIPEYYTTQEFNFTHSSGYREILPAWRQLSQSQDYGLRENFFDGWMRSDSLTFIKSVVVRPPNATNWTTDIACYAPNNWGVAREAFTIDPAYYGSNFNKKIYFSGVSADYPTTTYLSWRQPIQVSDKPMQITFKAFNSVIYPSEKYTNISTPSGRRLEVYNPMNAVHGQKVGEYLQLGLKINVLLHSGLDTYVLKNNWELTTNDGGDRQLNFSLPKVDITYVEGGEASGTEPREEEVTINIGTIPYSGDLELRIYGYYVIDKHNYWEDDYSVTDYTFDWEKCVTYINEPVYSFNTEDAETGQNGGTIISELHNVARKEEYSFGEIPENSGGSNAYAGGIVDTNGKEINGFQRNADGSNYNLLELVGREIIHFNKKNYNKLSGTIKNLDKEPLYFNKLFIREGKTYMPFSCSLNIISNEMNITTMQEVEPYVTESFTKINSEVVSGGGAKVGGGNNTVLQYSEEAGNAKRIYELQSATTEETKVAEIIIDNIEWPEAKKLPLGQIEGVVGKQETEEGIVAYVKDNLPLIGKEARFETLALPASAPTEPKEGEVYGYISNRSNSAVDLTPLFKRINVGTEDNPQWAVIPVDYNGNPVGIVSDTFITSGGRKGSSSGTGSSFNRLDSWDNYNPNAGDVLSAVLGYELKTRLDNLNVGLDETKLKEYLDTNEYITKTAGNELYAPLASFNELNTKFNDFLIGSDTNNIIDKWKELEAFLSGQTETTTLADLLAVKADKTALEAVTTRVTTVEGYFTFSAAKNALKLGGQLPEYYATASALSTHISTYNTFVNNTYAAHITAYNKHITEYNTYKSATDKRLADLEALWAIDEDNNGLYPKSGRGIWSESYITAGGQGTSGGGSGTGGGLIQNVYGYGNLGGTFNNTNLTDTFNAYTINQLYISGEAIKDRVEVLEANMGVINPDTLLSLNNYIASNSERITSLENWMNNPTADTAYFNELGIRDKLNVSGSATFDERITGVISEAVNLTGVPELKINGNTIAILVGEKTSAYITVPYSENTGKLGGQLPEYYATASALKAAERTVAGELSRISALLSSVEDQIGNATYETIIAREIGIEDKLNVAGDATFDSDLNVPTGTITTYMLSAEVAALDAVTINTLNGHTPITSGNISAQYVMYAATAGKLTNNALAGLAVGHSTQPVYFNGGVPVACTRYADASVNYATTAAIAIADKNGDDIVATYTTKRESRSTNYAAARLSGIVSNIEDWMNSPTADIAYFNELGIRDKLNVSGLATFDSDIKSNANILATGAITAGSDVRYKNKLQDVTVDVETIANAPFFNFQWKDERRDDRVYLGTTAQYWAQTNFRNGVIPTTDEKLWTMSYGQIAMGNTIVLARELLPIKHKVSEIDNLKDSLHKAERKIEILEQELNQYRRA